MSGSCIYSFKFTLKMRNTLFSWSSTCIYNIFCLLISQCEFDGFVLMLLSLNLPLWMNELHLLLKKKKKDNFSSIAMMNSTMPWPNTIIRFHQTPPKKTNNTLNANFVGKKFATKPVDLLPPDNNNCYYSFLVISSKYPCKS